MRTYVVTVPDTVSPEDAKEWCDENAGDLWDYDDCDGEVCWSVKDLEEGEEVPVTLRCTFDDAEYELDGFYPTKP